MGDIINKKVIGTICGVVIVSSVLSISKCDYFNNKHKEINIITTTSVKNNYFVIPDSSTRYLTEDDLMGLTSDELEIARNEIYARHGYIFVSNEWKDFFVGRYWYTPTSKDVTLNSVEEYNVSMILKEEATR